MYNISLLPVKYKQAISAEAKKNDVIISFVFTLIILAIVAILAFAVNAAVKLDLTRAKAENNVLLSEIDSLAHYRDLEARAEAAAANVDRLTGDGPSYRRALTGITASVPDTLQLRQIKFGAKKDSDLTSMEVSGNAAYFADVSVWIAQLDAMEAVGEVRCSYTNAAAADDSSRVRFELKMDILDQSAADDIVWHVGE